MTKAMLLLIFDGKRESGGRMKAGWRPATKKMEIPISRLINLL